MFVVVAVCALLSAHPLVSSGSRASATPSRSQRLAVAGLSEELGAQKARDRFLEGDFPGAVAAVDALSNAFEQGPAFLDDEGAWRAWADSRLTRALALRRLGKDEAADDELRALAVVRPTYVPDASFAPPKVVSRFQELREQLLNGPTVAVTVVVTGPGVLVLDGRPMPPGVLDVLPGTHWFGVDGRGQRVAVDKARELRLQGPAPTTGKLDDGPDLPPKVDPPPPTPPVDPAAVVVEDGPPWLLVGLGTGAALAAVIVVVVVVVAGQPPPAPNPGGTTLEVDASALDPPDGT